MEEHLARDPATLTDEEIAEYEDARWHVILMQRVLRDPVLAERIRAGSLALAARGATPSTEWMDRLLALSV